MSETDDFEKREDWYGALDEAPIFSRSQAGELRALLSNPVLISALGSALRDEKLSSERFRELDLTTQNGVAEAVRLQGRGDGVIALLDHIFTLTLEDE